MFEIPRRITYIARGGATKTRRLTCALHRAFVQWFETAQQRFMAPARIVQVRHDFIVLALRNHTVPAAGFIAGPVNLHDIPRLVSQMQSASGRHNAELLCWIPGHIPTLTSAPEGWSCDRNPTGRNSFHPTREAAWIAYLFEPLLAHANHQIVQQSPASSGLSPQSEPERHIHQLLIGPEPDAWSLQPVAALGQ